MARIPDKRVQYYVYNMYVKSLGWRDWGIWLGAKQTHYKSNEFIWLADNSSVVYTDWYCDQPNHLDNECVGLYLLKRYNKWADGKCSRAMSVLCERNATGSERNVNQIYDKLANQSSESIIHEVRLLKKQLVSLANEQKSDRDHGGDYKMGLIKLLVNQTKILKRLGEVNHHLIANKTVELVEHRFNSLIHRIDELARNNRKDFYDHQQSIGRINHINLTTIPTIVHEPVLMYSKDHSQLDVQLHLMKLSLIRIVCTIIFCMTLLFVGLYYLIKHYKKTCNPNVIELCTVAAEKK